jgi:diaminopimelate epimerase
MNKNIQFTKMHGAGNDFIVIDDRPTMLGKEKNVVIRNLCRHHWGIGADGLMFLEPIGGKEYVVHYFNADGFPSTMCGNGARCAAYFLYKLHPEEKDFILKMGINRYPARITARNQVEIIWDYTPELKVPHELDKLIAGKFRRAIFVDTGVPHLVVQVDSPLAEFEVEKWGTFYRNHDLFSPAGTNVNFIQPGADGIHIRTYERGVEAETLACGTGAMAAALAVKNWDLAKFPVKIHTRGGILEVGKTADNLHLWLQGSARHVFSGTFHLNDFREENFAGP